MLFQTRKALALSTVLSGMLCAVAFAQGQRDGQTLVIDDAHIDWFQKADVSALREGVIAKMEMRIGSEVKTDMQIGLLHKEIADLSVAEAAIQAKSVGATLKAEASKKLAVNVVLRNRALLAKGRNFVSEEEVQKGEAEYAAADAAVIEARETLELAQAKLASARQVAEEHIIRAPFSGVIIEEYKHPGESVRANEPVVKLGNLEKVRAWTYIPVEYAHRVNTKTIVEVQIRLSDGQRKHPIEQKKFRGVVTLVASTIQGVGEDGVRVYAELDNPYPHLLKPGYKASMTFYLEPEGTTVAAPPTARPSNTNLGSRDVDLPVLPR